MPTKVGAATVRLDRAYGSAPIQEFVKEKVVNGYVYSVRFNVAWEIFGATIDVSSRIDKAQSALDEIKRDLEWELSSDFNTNTILFVTDYDAPKVSVKISDVKIADNELDEFEHNSIATVRYNLDADFLADFARNKLNINPFKFLKNVPIFEIENMQLYVYMPSVDDFGNLQIGDDRIGYVDVTVEITVITVDVGSEDFEKCTKALFAAIWSSGIETEHERIDDLG